MRIILFDGVCHFCDASVQFIMKRDGGTFHFASLQSEIGQQYVKKFGLSVDSVVLVEQGQAFTKSTAALKIARHLGMPWSLLIVARVIPRSFRDLVYGFIAKNRYRWFGQKQECLLPSPKQRARFLE